MHILAILFICACSRNNFILFAQIACHDNEDNAPFQNNLTKEWKVSKASRYTAYQSPLLTEEPSGFYYLTQTEDASFILSSHIDY